MKDYSDDEKRGMKIVLKQLTDDLPLDEQLFILKKASKVLQGKRKFYYANDEIRLSLR